MDDKEILYELFNQLKQFQEAESLFHISGITIDDKLPRAFYTDVTDQHIKIHEVPLFLYEDFSFLSNTLVHFTSLLYMLQPFINKEADTYDQNIYDEKFLTYTGILNSTVYNFWNRIGNLLYCFFETGLSDDQVNIGRVLNNFPNANKESSYFKRINEIYSDSVRPLVNERHEDVHNQSFVTSRFYEIILARGEERREHLEHKLQIPEQFKEQINLAYEGFEIALRLIEERIPKT